ncbi:hypothetical protein BH18VER1_BH18VER1_21660 [soil metagenome]
MKVHLRQIPNEGLHLEGEEECPITDMAKEEIVCAGPLGYSLDLGVSEGELWANGSLSQPVELRCVACLEQFVHTIEVPEFAMITETSGPETVDLTPFVREDILLNLPAYPRCDREGDRVCPAPHMQRAQSDGPEVRKPDWSALDKLDL